MKRTKPYTCLIEHTFFMHLIIIGSNTAVVLASIDALKGQGHKVTPAMINEMCMSLSIQNRFN